MSHTSASNSKTGSLEPRRLLFRLGGCPYCQRAEAALDQAKIPYEKVEISPSDRSLVQLLSGQRTVPILVEVTGCENQDDDILAYIAARQVHA